ncbi:hypothetical protein [Neobacillus cucumis]|uniref:hypothetical protein n=1 Tax=Neobacillus cucumis TaxID=1740721 RepID=UPI0015E08699|nr:hypothetical protein [Neobacillus cucumis]
MKALLNLINPVPAFPFSYEFVPFFTVYDKKAEIEKNAGPSISLLLFNVYLLNT